eukprot:EC785989.1.p2 GENE.EC785989.1~~EC785989.1.p2  ORF type:complete len:70 (-),score=22.22 EC785989.1:129-338(-)
MAVASWSIDDGSGGGGEHREHAGDSLVVAGGVVVTPLPLVGATGSALMASSSAAKALLEVGELEPAVAP